LQECLRSLDAFLGKFPVAIFNFYCREVSSRCHPCLNLAYGLAESDLSPSSIVLAAEELRVAAHCIGRITGRVDVEEVLGAIFSNFCIGK
jgi:tRNA U34 5-carboxymethylaminomethyl modifying GTPase MnmE/TrmE